MFPIFFFFLLQAATKKRVTRKEIFKRAEQYVKEYRNQVGFVSSFRINQFDGPSLLSPSPELTPLSPT
jgi:hypothetical protein